MKINYAQQSEYLPLNFYSWEDENPYRPKTSVRFLISNDRFEVDMQTDETDIRAVFVDTNDPCYEDSCMEFFFAPFGRDNGYINIECNPNGVYLAEFGKKREGRVFLDKVTSIQPRVKSFVSSCGWSVNIVVPLLLIEDVFKMKFSSENEDLYVNFFKCGDKTIHPHYQSFTKMGDLPPGFHNPACFEKVEIIRR